MTGAAMAESPLDEVARALREHQAARAQLERDLDDARRQLDAERSRARTASGELGALEAKRDAAEHALTDARAQLAAASARAQGLEQQRDALRTRVDALERAGTAHAERQTQLREMSERVQLLEDFAAKAGPTAATASEAIADVRARQRGLLEALSRAEAASDARVEAARAAAAREAEALEEARAAHAVRRAALVSALFFRDQAAHAREAQRDALGQAGLAQRERGALDEAYAGALERERCAHERASALSAQCARLHEHARALTAADDVRAASEAALAQEVRTLEQDIVAWQVRASRRAPRASPRAPPGLRRAPPRRPMLAAGCLPGRARPPRSCWAVSVGGGLAGRLAVCRSTSACLRARRARVGLIAGTRLDCAGRTAPVGGLA